MSNLHEVDQICQVSDIESIPTRQGTRPDGLADPTASRDGTGPSAGVEYNGNDAVAKFCYADDATKRFRQCQLMRCNPGGSSARILIDGEEMVVSRACLFHAIEGAYATSLDGKWRVVIRDGKKQIVPDMEPIRLSWWLRANELAEWAMERLVNRVDCVGRYYREDGLVKQTTKKFREGCELSLGWLICHFRARTTEDIIGCHTTVWTRDGCLSRWFCIDIDWHGDGMPPEALWAAALAWHGSLVGLGFRPLLLDSNGRGGLRLYVLFDRPVPTHHVYRFAQWLIRDWGERGLDKAPETFPRQDIITRPDSKDGSYGNWLRIPGRHHKRDHWSRVWDGDGWLEGDPAIDAILATAGDPPSLIPADALVAATRPAPRKIDLAATRPSQTTGESGSLRLPESLLYLPGRASGIKRARQALRYLGPGIRDPSGREYVSDYGTWLIIGMALHELGTAGLELWIRWSRQCPQKFSLGSCREKWATFGYGNYTLGTVFHHARRHGWPG